HHRLVAIDELEGAIAGLFRYRAPLGLFAVAVRLGDVAQRIRPADAVDDGCEQLGALRQGAPDGDAAGRSPTDGQPRTGSVLLRAQLFANIDQIAPGVGFVHQLTGLVPVAAVLAAPAHVRVA